VTKVHTIKITDGECYWLIVRGMKSTKYLHNGENYTAGRVVRCAPSSFSGENLDNFVVAYGNTTFFNI
jgi:hypothetical protein